MDLAKKVDIKKAMKCTVSYHSSIPWNGLIDRGVPHLISLKSPNYPPLPMREIVGGVELHCIGLTHFAW